MFQVNPDRITSARAVLAGRHRIAWIIGGAAAGKSTICRAIAAGSGLAVYDMDERICGSYGARYTAERHPAHTAWLAAENSLAWALSLSDAAFDAFGRATTAEYLDIAGGRPAHLATYAAPPDRWWYHPSLPGGGHFGHGPCEASELSSAP